MKALACSGRHQLSLARYHSMVSASACGHALRVDVAGAGPPDFLCLHGLVDALEIWDRLAGPLAERGRIVRFDQRGHGESEAPPGAYRREDLAADRNEARCEDERLDE